MTDEQLKKFMAFGPQVKDLIPGRIMAAGLRADGYQIYTIIDQVEYKITVQPHWDHDRAKAIVLDP